MFFYFNFIFKYLFRIVEIFLQSPEIFIMGIRQFSIIRYFFLLKSSISKIKLFPSARFMDRRKYLCKEYVNLSS